MTQPRTRRVLGFERMEDRLVLSAATGINTLSLLDYLNVDQGGLVHFADQFEADAAIGLSAWTSTTWYILNAGTSNAGNIDADLSAYPRLEDYYNEWLHTRGAVVLGTAETDNIVPIPQPQVGRFPEGGGAVAIAEIFTPRQLGNGVARQDTAIAEWSQGVESARVTAVKSQLQEPVSARGRDAYFEVAVFSSTAQPRAAREARLSENELVPLNHEVSATLPQATFPAGQKGTKPVEEQRLPQSPQPAPVPKATQSSSATPVAERLVQVAGQDMRHLVTKLDVNKADTIAVENDRDAVFAKLWGGDVEGVEEVVVVRSGEGGKHYLAWPTLAVLVGGSLVARQRRTLRADQLPSPRRNPLSLPGPLSR